LKNFPKEIQPTHCHQRSSEEVGRKIQRSWIVSIKENDTENESVN